MKPRAKLWGFVLAVNDLVHDIKATLTPLTAIINRGGFRGGSGGSLEPPPPPPWDQIISFSWRNFRKVRLI